jgi:hypothetical protein
MAPLPQSTLARWRRATPRTRRRAALLAAVLLAWGLALAAANRPGVQARLRGSIRDALARRLPGARIGEGVSVDPLFRVTFGPLVVPAIRPGAPPILEAERVRVRAGLLPLFAGRVEPASVRLFGVRIAPGERLSELRSLAERLRARPEPKGGATPARAAPRDWPAIHLRHATLLLRHGDGELELGPLDASVLRSRDASRDDLEVALSHRRGGRAWAQLHRGPDGFRLRASAVDLGPSLLPPAANTGAVRWSEGTASVDVALSGAAGAKATGRLRGRLDRAAFLGDRLAPEPVGPVSATLEGELEADPTERRVALRAGRLRALGAVDASLEAEARLGPGLPFSFAVEGPGVDYGTLVEALPAPLQPPVEAPRPSGPLSFRFAVAGPLREPSAWSVEASLDLSHLREAARRAAPVPLRAPFTWRPEVEAGTPPAILVGPGNPDFVPLADLPEHVLRAVTTSEDAGFFAHAGFDFEELKNAFAQGAEAGRVVRGASTITQQLAKNLFLSREKILARKAREAMVAIALEATVPKARLLEIYLNVAEWGPGLWGIGPAARHYFGKPARDLTVREAAFLASIIPNPVRYHGYYVRGALDEAWTERLRTILLHMAQAGVLDEAQLLEALDAPLAFAGREAASEGAEPAAAGDPEATPQDAPSAPSAP